MLFSLVFWNMIYPMIIHGLPSSIAYITMIFKKLSYLFSGNLVEKSVKFIMFISSVILFSNKYSLNWRNILYFTILSTSAFHIGFEYYIYKYGDTIEDMYQVFIFDENNENNIEYQPIFAEFGVQNNDMDIRNDKQNVHDSTVNKTLKDTIKKLSENTIIKSSKEDTLREIKEYIDKESDDIKKIRMTTALNTIIKEKTKIYNIDMTLLDLLQIVWNRFKDPTLSHNKSTLINNLLRELIDSTEVSIKPLCTTGIYARIVDSSNCIDPLVNIKPKWALRKEILNYANKLYKTMTEELSEKDLKHLNSLNPTKEDEDWIIGFRGKYQLRLMNYCTRTYIDTNLLTKKELNKEIDSWIDSIIV